MKTENESPYSLAPDGRLSRDGEHIGSVQDGEFTPLEGKSNYSAAVKRWLNNQDKIEEPAKPKTSKELAKMDERGMDKESVEQARRYRASRESDIEHAARTNCPQPPDQNPQFGDKTPAYVEWLERYYPEKFAQVYGVSSAGEIPVFTNNEKTGEREISGTVQGHFARRKTHRTMRDESQNAISDGQDWGA